MSVAKPASDLIRGSGRDCWVTGVLRNGPPRWHLCHLCENGHVWRVHAQRRSGPCEPSVGSEMTTADCGKRRHLSARRHLCARRHL